MTKAIIQNSLNLAVEHHRAGRLAEAEKIYRAILNQQPAHSVALHLLGVLIGQTGNPTAAVDLIRQAIAIHPSNADYHGNLAKFLIELGETGAAMASCRQAIALKPLLAEAHLNLGVALQIQDQLDAAIASFRRAIALKPDYAEAYGNLGAALKARGQLDAAAAAFREALALNPDFADGHWNLALLELLQGNFQQGWTQYERRLQFDENASLTRSFPQPIWNGEDLRGRTILLIAEQGFGDTIQFIRYAPLLTRRGAKVIALVRPELLRLLDRAPGIDQVFTLGGPFPPFDFQCPLLSLPRIFATTLQSIPAEVPYLSADSSLARRWSERFASSDRRQRIGLVWAGSPTHKSDRLRSISPTLLSPLVELKDVRFFTLQKGEASRQSDLFPPGMDITDWTPDLIDFADTAALIANLDLVISVDTAVAHLAGAMGKTTWLMLPFILDWRWLLDRSDSPWYPTMRLFRQPQRGNWPGVVQTIASELHSNAADSSLKLHPNRRHACPVV
jgi:tetratricopeptide (TPR) repeat protein